MHPTGGLHPRGVCIWRDSLHQGGGGGLHQGGSAWGVRPGGSTSGG